MDQAPSPHGNDMFDMGDDGRGFDGFGSNPAVSIGMGAASMGMGGIVQQGEFSRQSMSQGMASRDFFGGHIQHAGLAGQASQGMDPRGWDSEHSPVPRNMYARAEARPSSHRQETQSTNLYRQHMRVAPAHEIHKPAALSGPPASFATKKRPRVDKVTAAPSDSSSSKRSRAEKHYKEIRLLCDALAPHIRDVKVTDCVYLPARAPRAHGFPIWQCNERAVQMYDKYRDSGKAAGRPSRPMYAAVVLAMSGEEDEEGDESDCKKRLQLLTNACSAVWGTDAPDKRKIWDSLIVLLRIVPLRCPQDNLAGSVLSRLFRSIQFSKVPAHEEATRELLIKLATTLEQGPLAGKAPKTVAACTMHLYCRHSHVGMQAARTIATSLQVGESTVRTNLRGIYVGGASGNSQMLLSGDAQAILDSCPKPSDFELNLPGENGRPVTEDAGDALRAGTAVPAIGIDLSTGGGGNGGNGGGGGGMASRLGGAAGSTFAARSGPIRDSLHLQPSSRESLYSNPPPLVSTPNTGSSCGVGQPASRLSRAAQHHSNAVYAAQAGMYSSLDPPGVPYGLARFAEANVAGRSMYAEHNGQGGEALYRDHVAEGRYSLPQHGFMGGPMGGEHTGFETGAWTDGF